VNVPVSKKEGVEKENVNGSEQSPSRKILPPVPPADDALAQEIRDRRVQESLAIYKEQQRKKRAEKALEIEKLRRANSAEQEEEESKPARVMNENSPLEMFNRCNALDSRIGEVVRKFVFDFGAAAQALRREIRRGDFLSIPTDCWQKFSADICRERFASVFGDQEDDTTNAAFTTSSSEEDEVEPSENLTQKSLSNDRKSAYLSAKAPVLQSESRMAETDFDELD
jgi:hypothetical protein